MNEPFAFIFTYLFFSLRGDEWMNDDKDFFVKYFMFAAGVFFLMQETSV